MEMSFRIKTTYMEYNFSKIVRTNVCFTVGLFGFKEVGGSEKVGCVISYFRCPSKHRKRKMEKLFFLLFSLLHNHFLTSRVLKLILWSCKSHL